MRTTLQFSLLSSYRNISRPALLLLLILLFPFTNFAVARCLPIEDNSHPCRYPDGDVWCKQNDRPPYAYRTKCKDLPSSNSTKLGSVGASKTDECYLNPNDDCLFELSLKAAESVMKTEAMIAAFGDIAQLQAKIGRENRTKMIINRLIKEASDNDDPFWKAKYYTAIAVIQGKLGLKEDALISLKEAKKNAGDIVNMRIDAKVAAFADIAVARSEIGDLTAGKTDLEKLANSTRQYRNITERTFSLVEIGIALTKTGDKSAGRLILEEVVSNRDIQRLYHALAFYGLGKIEMISGNLDEGRRKLLIASNIIKQTHPYSRGEAYIYAEIAFYIAVSQAEAGQITEARKTAEAITFQDQEDWAMENITRIEGESKSNIIVKEIMDLANSGNIKEALDVARSITTPLSRVRALNEITKVF